MAPASVLIGIRSTELPCHQTSSCATRTSKEQRTRPRDRRRCP